MFRRTVTFAAVVGLAFVLAPAAQADLMSQLGVLDLTADYGFGAGINPSTEAPWALDDPYHLVFVTSTFTDATSTDIAVYNGFVQGVADVAGLGTTLYGPTEDVTWYAIASTATDDARANAIVSAPVFNMISLFVIKGSAELWDSGIAWPLLINIIYYDESGVELGAHVYTGTLRTGYKAPGMELGSGNEMVGENWAIGRKWVEAYAYPGVDHPLYGLSEPLRVVPEPATLALMGLGLGGLLLRRRR